MMLLLLLLPLLLLVVITIMMMMVMITTICASLGRHAAQSRAAAPTPRRPPPLRRQMPRPQASSPPFCPVFEALQRPFWGQAARAPICSRLPRGSCTPRFTKKCRHARQYV
jgi:hypothetical protein